MPAGLVPAGLVQEDLVQVDLVQAELVQMDLVPADLVSEDLQPVYIGLTDLVEQVQGKRLVQIIFITLSQARAEISRMRANLATVYILESSTVKNRSVWVTTRYLCRFSIDSLRLMTTIFIIGTDHASISYYSIFFINTDTKQKRNESREKKMKID